MGKCLIFYQNRVFLGLLAPMLSHWLNKEWPGENRIPQKSLVILVNHRFPHHKMNVFGRTPFSDTPKDIFKKTMLASAVGIIHDITTMLADGTPTSWDINPVTIS